MFSHVNIIKNTFQDVGQSLYSSNIEKGKSSHKLKQIGTIFCIFKEIFNHGLISYVKPIKLNLKNHNMTFNSNGGSSMQEITFVTKNCVQGLKFD